MTADAINLQSQIKRRNLAEMQIRAHVGNIIGLGLVAIVDIAGQALVQKAFKYLPGPCRSAFEKIGDGRHILVNLQPLQDRVDVL